MVDTHLLDECAMNLIKHLKDAEVKNLSLIIKAVICCIKSHAGQKRNSGEDYHTHPITVAFYVSNYSLKIDVLIAALLHDTLEDTALPPQEIEQQFGARVLELVQKLTRKIDPVTKKKYSAASLLDIFYKDNDHDVMLIKQCDRIHNMETIEYMSKEDKEKIFTETIQSFIPYAMCFQTNKKMEHHLLKVCGLKIPTLSFQESSSSLSFL